MKNLLMIGLLCLTLLAVQDAVAQVTSTGIAKMTSEEAISFLNKKLSEVKGVKNYNQTVVIDTFLRMEGSKIRIRKVSKDSNGRFYTESFFFDPKEITSIEIVLPEKDTVNIMTVKLPSDFSDVSFNGANDEASLNHNGKVIPMSFAQLAYLNGDGTNREKIEKALLRLKELALIQSPNSATTQQDGPLLEETFEYLEGKINGSKATIQRAGRASSTSQYRQTYTYRIKRAEDAVLVLEEVDFYKGTGLPSSSGLYEKTLEDCSTEVSILLNEIVPASIKVSELEGVFIVNMTAADNKKIKADKTCKVTADRNNIGRRYLNSFGIVFSNEETAEKVAKALTHAVKLNGGKEELF